MNRFSPHRTTALAVVAVLAAPLGTEVAAAAAPSPKPCGAVSGLNAYRPGSFRVDARWDRRGCTNPGVIVLDVTLERTDVLGTSQKRRTIRCRAGAAACALRLELPHGALDLAQYTVTAVVTVTAARQGSWLWTQHEQACRSVPTPSCDGSYRWTSGR